MNKPKAFISSTIYDLTAERNIISKTLEIKGFETIMSEYGYKFPIDSNANNTYDNCVQRVKECNLFILYVGKRLGSSRKFNWEDTIVYKEFEAASDPALGLPIYIFVNKQVDNLRPAFKKDVSKDKQNFQSLHDDIDVRIFEFIEKFSNLIDNQGNKQKNFWYFPVDGINNLEEILNYQIDNLLLSALRAYSAASQLKNAPYELRLGEVIKNGTDTILTLQFLNFGPSDIFDVKVKLYCTIQSDLQYWHFVPKIGMEIAPHIKAMSGWWYWSFDLSRIDIDPQRKRINKNFNEKIIDIIIGEKQSFTTNYLIKDGAKLGRVKIKKHDINFRFVCSFVELLSGKLRVIRQDVSMDELINIEVSTIT